MLNTVKGYTKSWSTKIIIILLALSFAMWGISDVFRPSSSDVVATVGSTDISTQTLAREFNAEFRRIQSRYKDFTNEEAIKLGIPTQTLKRLLEQALVVEEARTNGMLISDNYLANIIISENPGLIKDGVFDKSRYERSLQRTGQDLETFENKVRDSILSKQILESISSTGEVPQTLANMLKVYDKERRKVITLEIPDSKMIIDFLSDDLLRNNYQENIEVYSSPEYRGLSLLELNIDAVEENIDLTDEDIFAEYDYRSSEFQKPESREVIQILSNDKFMIEKISKSVTNKSEMIQASNEASSKNATVTNFNSLERGTLPKEAEDIIFSTKEKSITTPIQTPFGWNVFFISQINQPGLIPFENVKDDLKKEMIKDLSLDILYGLSGTVEDILGSGGSIENAAEAIALDLIKIPPIDSFGNSESGKKFLSGNPAKKEILDTAFRLSDNSTSNLQETPNGTYFILRIDSIEERKPKEFEEVKEEIMNNTLNILRSDATYNEAKSIVEAIKAGKNIKIIAKEKDLNIKTEDSLSRNDMGFTELYSQDFMNKLFDSRVDSIDPVFSKINNGHVVGIVLEKFYSESSSFSEDTEKMFLKQIDYSRQNDLLILYRFALQKKHNIEVNGNIFEKLFASE
tara:strand:+ start:25738 stop:27633 length:1896 start_codon:yes stop_codon:yes gene_type:complete